MEYGQAKGHAAPCPEEIDVLKSAGEGEKAFFGRCAIGGIVSKTSDGVYTGSVRRVLPNRSTHRQWNMLESTPK